MIDLASRIDDIKGFRVWFISIDIVSSNPEHHLANANCFKRILAHIAARRIHGWVIGPPSETWTATRFLALLDYLGPRPLQSALSFWGLANLSRRESAQLEIGNTLLRVAVTLCLDSLGCGLSGIIEHPEESQNDDYPLIWKLPIVRSPWPVLA